MAISERYEWLAKTKTGYTITLAKLTIGKSLSAGNPLTHILFESFSDHGERRVIVRTRTSGSESVFIAVMNAMMEVGTEFESITPCYSEMMLTALGAWFQARNPYIEHYELVTQNEAKTWRNL